MLNVIICDDNTMDLNKIVKIVEKFMNSNNLSYKKYIFTDYDNNFLKIVDSKMPFKIFILDIEVPSRSGIDIARLIRKKDISSPIIFLTGHNELGMELLMEDIPFTAFISKFIKCEIRLKKCLVNSINEMNKYRVLKLRDSSISCRIKYDNILYITTDTVDRKSLIITDYNTISISKPLKEIKDLLCDDFIKTHKSCIVNSCRVDKIDLKKREILFDNGLKIDLLSKKYCKEIIK